MIIYELLQIIKVMKLKNFQKYGHRIKKKQSLQAFLYPLYV